MNLCLIDLPESIRACVAVVVLTFSTVSSR